MHSLLACAVLLLPPTFVQGTLPANASEEARAAWDRLCKSSGPADREPIAAFRLRADVLVRSGVQNNQLQIDYSYLAPDCIRFMLPSKNVTGRSGPLPEHYWVKDGKDVVTLAGREYTEDRRQVDEAIALARNYVALSNPARLQVLTLERLSAPPADISAELQKRARGLTWLAIESPDFALVRREGQSRAGGIYRVDVGLSKDSVPDLVVIRESGPEARSDPLLVELGQYQERDGFRIPFQLMVHVLDRSAAPLAFAEKPSQEIYLTEAQLRPQLTVKDFRP